MKRETPKDGPDKGVEVIGQEKLRALLKLRYSDSLDDALADRGGDTEKIHAPFTDFQHHLYEVKV
jgi:hypothetical protein